MSSLIDEKLDAAREEARESSRRAGEGQRREILPEESMSRPSALPIFLSQKMGSSEGRRRIAAVDTSAGRTGGCAKACKEGRWARRKKGEVDESGGAVSVR